MNASSFLSHVLGAANPNQGLNPRASNPTTGIRPPPCISGFTDTDRQPPVRSPPAAQFTNSRSPMSFQTSAATVPVPPALNPQSKSQPSWSYFLSIAVKRPSRIFSKRVPIFRTTVRFLKFQPSASHPYFAPGHILDRSIYGGFQLIHSVFDPLPHHIVFLDAIR